MTPLTDAELNYVDRLSDPYVVEDGFLRMLAELRSLRELNLTRPHCGCEDVERYMDRQQADLREADTEVERLTKMLTTLGFCAKDGESMPCTTCGAGL